MSDRKRYMAGIVMTLIFHMAIFLVLGFLGGRYVKIVPGAEILQITLNAGGGKKGSGKAGSMSPVNNKKQEKTVILRQGMKPVGAVRGTMEMMKEKVTETEVQRVTE